MSDGGDTSTAALFSPARPFPLQPYRYYEPNRTHLKLHRSDPPERGATSCAKVNARRYVAAETV